MVHAEHLQSAMKLSCSVVAVLILLAGGVAQSRAGILHGSDVFSDELLTINTSTGAGTSVGALGFDRVEGLAFDPNTNTLYGSDFDTEKLLTINTSTGAGTPVGALGFTIVSGLAFVPEPSTVILAALGLVGLAAFGWRRRK